MLYEPCHRCGGFHISAAASGLPDFTDEITRLAREIYNTKKGKNYDPALLNATARQMAKAMAEGYGKDSIKIEWDSPDAEMIGKLTRDAWHFSAAKNYQQLRDMTLALNDKGKLRDWASFQDEVAKTNAKYNVTWLRTEYDSAVAASQMASRWVQFGQNKRTMPMLQYQTVGDSNVRDEHQRLDGIVKHIDDSFWNTYYPPNGWRCRCDVQQLPGQRTETDTTRRELPTVPDLFRTNVGKTGLMFPAGHPYYKDCPKPVLSQAIAYLPPENSYMTVLADNNKKINIHLLHNQTEIKNNLKIANDLAKLGYKDFHLLPDLNEADKSLRSKFLPKDYTPFDDRKNPDCLMKDKHDIDMVSEFKFLTGERNFATRINEAALQAEYAVIKFDFTHKKLGISSVKETVTKRMLANSNLKGVIVLDKDGGVIYELYQ